MWAFDSLDILNRTASYVGKRLTRSGALVLLLALSSHNVAQDDPTPTKAKDPPRIEKGGETAMTDQPDKAAVEGSKDEKNASDSQPRSRRNFRPSEKITADNSVPYPVDI